MLRYIVRRLLMMIPVLIGATLIVFAIMDSSPGDPALSKVGVEASPEQVEELRESMGLNDPFFIRYGRFLLGLLHGDLGTSYKNDLSVMEQVMSRLPNTFILSFAALLFAMAVGIPVGIISARRQYTIFDNITMLLTLIGAAAPHFWLGLMGVIIFAVNLGWLPAAYSGSSPYLLCLILPQGFLTAGSAPQIDALGALLLVAALTLLDEKRPLGGMLLYGAAFALSGAVLYALPLVALLGRRGGAKGWHAALAALVALAVCLPAVLCGVPAGRAAGSLFTANVAVPEYAAGVPNLMSAFPRAAMEEMPEYALIRVFPEIDAVTNAPVVYTQAHFELLMHGLTFAALAMFIGLCAWLKRAKTASALRRTLTLALGAMILCPGAGMGAWLPLCMLCLAAILREPETRLPACMVLFATAGGCCYPATGETLLRPVYAFALCAAALFMLLGVIPGAKTSEVKADD